MIKTLPKNCKVVVIGGGIVGCSVAYHLAKFGWKDTILLERDQLTSGTTWHAAGLVSQLGPSAAITKIRKYTLDLYKELEKKVDHSAGLRLNGALSIAENKGRWQELQRQATTAQLFDVDVRILDKEQIKKDYPIVNTDEVLGGILMPGDGAADPSGVTHMLAKAARMEGAKIFEKCPVEEILTKNGKISGVKVNGQKIDCEYIVLSSGMWSRQIGEKAGVSIPLYPAEHFYIITEPIENLSKTLPVIRDFDVAGASPSGNIGEIEKSYGHLIKNLAIQSTKLRPKVDIFGNNYNTKDGTCIRDYIHVSDLADIHILALKKISSSKKSLILNCGYGKGYSVKEIVEIFKKIKKGVIVKYKKKRIGDVAQIYSDNSKLKKILKWKPKFNNIQTILKSAINWEKKLT